MTYQNFFCRLLTIVSFLLVCTGTAYAANPAPAVDSGDVAWMIVATVFVLMMSIPGLSLFYSGLVRVKNSISLQTQVLLCFVVILMLWFIYGYALTFSDFADFDNILNRLLLWKVEAGTTVPGAEANRLLPLFIFFLFQGAFAAITCALIIGALAERTRIAGVIVFTIIWFSLSYIPIAHMIWHKSVVNGTHDGLLTGWGIQDFAGGMVVHVNAGVAGLVASYMVRARRDFGKKPLSPHSLNNVITGASLLWLGWIGFNAGSALSANGQSTLAFVNTVVAPAAACLSWLMIEHIKYGKVTSLGAVSGVLAGLVGVTPAAGLVAPWAALVIGVVSAQCSFMALSLVKRKWQIDDSLDVFAIHGVSGLAGSLLVGIFAFVTLGGALPVPKGSSLVEAIGTQLLLQASGCGIVIVISAVATWIGVFVARSFSQLRADANDEETGLDIVDHGETAYNFLNE